VASGLFVGGFSPSPPGFGPSPRVISYVNGNTSRLRRRATSSRPCDEITTLRFCRESARRWDPFRMGQGGREGEGNKKRNPSSVRVHKSGQIFRPKRFNLRSLVSNAVQGYLLLPHLPCSRVSIFLITENSYTNYILRLTVSFVYACIYAQLVIVAGSVVSRE